MQPPGELSAEERAAGSALPRYLPHEVAELLGIPPSTLRLYAAQFDPLLSPSARRDPLEPGPPYRHRRYTLEDVALLERARRLVEAGLSYQQARRQLAGEAPDLVVTPTRRRLVYRRSSPIKAASSDHSPSLTPRTAPMPLDPASPDLAARTASALETVLERLTTVESLLRAQCQLAESLDRRLEAIEGRVAQMERALADDGPAPEPERRRGWLGKVLRGDRSAR